MSLQVIEGTWEEIERHRAELMGHRFRLIPLSDKEILRKPEAPALRKQSVQQMKSKAPVKATVLTGFGAFKDALPSSEEYMREKRAEIEREERHFEICS